MLSLLTSDMYFCSELVKVDLTETLQELLATNCNGVVRVVITHVTC